MVGYPESFTDPSYLGQILCLTYPLIGNYGVPDCKSRDEFGLLKNVESDRPRIKALLCGTYSEDYSHHGAVMSLGDWLKQHDIPGLTGIDTRKLTLELQKCGTLRGRIVDELNTADGPIEIKPINIADVSTRREYTVGRGNGLKVCLVDCGTKINIIRHLVNRGCEVHVVPHNHKFSSSSYDGIFISNGPGDPRMCVETIANVKEHLGRKGACPLMGICLGHQIMCLAAGMRIGKMKYGNRGYNQPVLCESLGRTFITSQNHGYAVLNQSVALPWETWCVNKNDGSNEGVRHKHKPFCSVQFHPESRGGPHDTTFLFDEYVQQCKEFKNETSCVKKIIVLGSGGLCIGQAGEFDYSGSQAIKKFKSLGYKVVLVNPNIATNQTRKGFADAIYYHPVTPDYVRQVLEKERPDFICLSFGGQTALNCGMELYDTGVLHEFGVEVMGTTIDSIKKTEDRALFSCCMKAIGEKTPRSCSATSVADAIAGARIIGYPVLVRAAFALGGLGSGFCSNEAELKELVEYTFTKTSQVLIDEDLRGWKEVEYEVMRDRCGNCITVCNMENFDPLGVHTGDSIVVAPSQTLNNDEFNLLREASLKIADSLGIVGECNVQLTLDPHSMEYRVIEVNPRLSRSSALASKATGYPIASIAAQLCLGELLHDVMNPITGTTTANFEPSLDYIVVKMPKWDTSKFPGVDSHLGSAMQSVGEVMAIGRSFEEAFQKASRMATGHEFEAWGETSSAEIANGIKKPTPDRVRLIAHAFRQGHNAQWVHELSRIDMWYLEKLYNIHRGNVGLETAIASCEELGESFVMRLKRLGFSDRRIAAKIGISESVFAQRRRKMGIVPVRKCIDTVAGEFEADTNYHYLTYHSRSDEAVTNKKGRETVIVLGSGKYRIGSSVEFDYATVGCVQALMSEGYRTIVVNYNPETMSTDYDVSDNLYFEELSAETVEEIYKKEGAVGVVVSFGGQEPNNIASELAQRGLKLMGPTAEMIDTCEDREKYSTLLDRIGIAQPEWVVAKSSEEIQRFVAEVGFPLVVRPSYVLSGAAMQVVTGSEDLESCLQNASAVSADKPVVITRLVRGAREVEVDAVFSAGTMIANVVGEHVEDAGVHSGDATLVIPPHTIDKEDSQKCRDIVSKIGSEIGFSGICNTQLLVKGEWVGVIETNMRASRSAPFASKAIDVDLINLATKAIVCKSRLDVLETEEPKSIGVKVAQFSFNRLPNADPDLGIEMKSTGEVACFGSTLEEAFMKGMIASRSGVKSKNGASVHIIDNDVELLHCAKANGHHVVEALEEADLAIDCSHSEGTRARRRLAIDLSIPFVSDKKKAELLLRAMTVGIKCTSYQDDCIVCNTGIKLFVRQGFTESGGEQQIKLQKVLDALVGTGRGLQLVTGERALAKDTFKPNFENETGLVFTPQSFREHRLALLNKSDAMVILRTGLSESTVFEVAHNIMNGKSIPVFFAIEPGCEIKTTLLRELDGYKGSTVVYKVIEGGIENLCEDQDFVSFLDNISTNR